MEIRHGHVRAGKRLRRRKGRKKKNVSRHGGICIGTYRHGFILSQSRFAQHPFTEPCRLLHYLRISASPFLSLSFSFSFYSLISAVAAISLRIRVKIQGGVSRLRWACISFVIRNIKGTGERRETRPEIISVVYAFIMHPCLRISFFVNNATPREHMSHLSRKCRKSNFTLKLRAY